MNSPRTVSFRIASDKVEELDRLAKTMDRDRSYLLNEAIDGYLREQRRFVVLVEEGREAARQGELIDDEEVGGRIDSRIERRLRKEA